MDSFNLKTKVYANMQSISLLSQIKGSNALVVSDKIMEELGYLGQVLDHLSQAGIKSTVFTGVRPDPDTGVIAQGVKLYNQCAPDVVVAIGGGSAIDSAKGILYTCSQIDSNAKKPLFVAIPSTSGTGSEVTNFTVITAEGEKLVIVDDLISPDIAILDSTCIKHVPKHVIADSGVDVLVHALEAAASVNATDFTDAMAEKSIKMIFEYLPVIYQNPNDDFARDRVQNASCMAGIAFTNSGLGIVHSMAHIFGATFKVSHGRSNALLLTSVMRYNSGLCSKANDDVMKTYAKIANLLGLNARTPREGTVSLIDAVEKLLKQLGIEASIKERGIDADAFEAAIPQMTQTALRDKCTPTNPKQPTAEDLAEIYRFAFNK